MEGDANEVLLPCAICGRTFMPRSLEKHSKICERAAIKKRKPFDSAKQRIQGTDLAEFLPRQEKKRYSNEEKRKSSWKETHDDFLRTIRAARNETASIVINQRQSSSNMASPSTGAPTRANEKGMCPTCSRQFGIKAYDRHVAWCKERSTRLPISPATKNIAKERLEARMKYRAPALKNRRQSNREKYSQSCTTIKTPPNKIRETVSVPDNSREKIKENFIDSQRPITTGKGEQLNNTETYQLGKTKETIKRPPTDRPTSCCSRSINPEPRNVNVPLLISLKPKKKSNGKIIQNNDAIQCSSTKSDKIQRTMIQVKKLENKMNDESNNMIPLMIDHRTLECEKKNRNLIKIDHVITARNQKDSKVNDVTVNDNILEMIVQPCNIYNNDYDNDNYDYEEDNVDQKNDDDELITWEKMKINRDNNNRLNININIKDNIINEISSNKCNQLVNTYLQSDNNKSFDDDDDDDDDDDKKNDRDMIPIMDDLLINKNDIYSFIENDTNKMITWSNTVQKLNQTYLIKDSDDPDILIDTNIIQDSNQSNDSHNNNNNNNNDDDDRMIESISIKDDHSEINHEINHVNVVDINENDSTFNYCNSTEAKSIIYPIEKYDKIVDNVINDDDQSDKLFYTNIMIENKMINDDIVPLSSSSDIEIVNEMKDDLLVENINLNENNLSLVDDNENKMNNNNNNNNNSNFVEYIDKNDSYYLRGSDTKSEEELHNLIYENYSNEQFKYSTEEEEDEKEKEKEENDEEDEEEKEEKEEENVEDDEEEEEEEEEKENDEENEENINHKNTIIINHKDYENDLKRSLTINSKTSTIRSIKINSKIQENMNLLRGSTNTLISSIEENDYVNKKRSSKSIHSICNEKDNVNNKSYIIENNYEKYNNALPEIRRDNSMNKNVYNLNEHYYWKKMLKLSKDRIINDPMTYNYKQNRLHKRNPKTRILPPVLIDSSSSPPSRIQRSTNSSNRPLWSNYIRRRPDFNLVLRCRIGGTSKEYDPFLLAERQMNDLLSDSSDLSLTEIPSTSSNKSHFPLSHSSAFVKYPYENKTKHLDKSITNELDELTSDFSSDSTETNSISHEIFVKEFNDIKLNDREKKMINKELGRRMILDKSKALGNDIDQNKSTGLDKRYKNDDISSKISDKVGGSSTKKISKSQANKLQTVRAYSAPKSIYQRKHKHSNSNDNNNDIVKLHNNVKNDYLTFSSSDLSINSIVSSEIDMKRSNSVFDQLITSFDNDDDDLVGNDDSFPSLRSLLRNESLRTSSSNGPIGPDNNSQFNGHISDDEISSTDNYKQRENKINADSAYSSLNRKYSNHGRSSSSNGNNDTSNLMEDNLMVSRNNRRENNQSAITKTKCRMSRFCHECGSRFPETAKYCCQCGVKRLAL